MRRIPKGHYVYLHRNPETLKVFYVGVGVGPRMYDFKNRNSSWKKYVKENGTPKLEVLESGMSWSDSRWREFWAIKHFNGKSPLVNRRHMNSEYPSGHICYARFRKIFESGINSIRPIWCGELLDYHLQRRSLKEILRLQTIRRA